MLKMSAKIFFNSLIVSAFLFFSTIALRAQESKSRSNAAEDANSR